MSPPFRIRTPCPRCLCLQEVPGLGDANRADPSAGADRDLGPADRDQGHGYHSAGGGVDLAGLPDDGQSSCNQVQVAPIVALRREWTTQPLELLRLTLVPVLSALSAGNHHPR